ncbi:hypothetical protein VHEMI02127 [[Torrubiella] hemipterigena]|uniref:N-acetyltransferase domain-containing protein n=1 Tax=[Torrubiella] hemipterigena TaxID=1531966 RepID=A0A0A1T788_9HYPO|nr:hypothetical protein VHEMI02127 [[Torrubiella] hemipterigena]
MANAIVIRQATAQDAVSIGNLYVASRADALPTLKQVHTEQQVRNWIVSLFQKDDNDKYTSDLYVAETDGKIVGFLRVQDTDLDQLYLLPGYYRMGIGSRLLNKAKELSPEKLTLYTFQVNVRARAFYEGHGFTVVDFNDGSRNEENEPDILYQWVASNKQAS